MGALINGFKSMDDKLLSMLKNPAIAKLVNALSDGEMSALDYESGELMDKAQILSIVTRSKQKKYGRKGKETAHTGGGVVEKRRKYERRK